MANDFIIICCGSNDTDNVKLNMVLNNFNDFIQRVTWTNVILLTIPFRHDLKAFNTALNKNITVFNKKLLKLEELFLHLSVV
jgi:lysophospholipase L1-like esterase